MIGAPHTPPVQSNGGAPAAPVKIEDNSSNSVTPKAGDDKGEDGLEQPNGENVQDETLVNPNPNPNSPPRSPVLRPR